MALVRGFAIVLSVSFFFSINAFPQDSAHSAQDPSSFSQPQSFLREASTLIPQIEKEQRSSAAANIAGQQTRIGDLDGALVSAQRTGSPVGRVLAAGSIAYALAFRGNLPLALEVIQNSSKADDPAKANEYLSVAQSLAERHQFERGLEVARFIQRAKPYSGQTGTFIDTLLRIQEEQFKAGDRAGAQETIDEALAAAEWEKEHPEDAWFAESTPAMFYASIATTLSKEGDRPAAVAVVNRIYDLLAAATTEQSKENLLLSLGYAQIGIGDLEAATATAAQLSPGNHRDGILMQIALERARVGDIPGSLDDAAALSYEPWRNISLREVAARYSALGNDAQALATLDLIPEPEERAEGLIQIAWPAVEKHAESAPLALELAYEAAMTAGAKTKPLVFEQIAVAHAVLGDFGAAEDMIARLDDSSKYWPLWNVTEMLIAGGREAEAISLAESQSAPRPKAYALLGVATALINKQRKVSHN